LRSSPVPSTTTVFSGAFESLAARRQAAAPKGHLPQRMPLCRCGCGRVPKDRQPAQPTPTTRTAMSSAWTIRTSTPPWQRCCGCLAPYRRGLDGAGGAA
jgi:hypothetical protein